MKLCIMIIIFHITFSQEQLTGYSPNPEYLTRVDSIRNECLTQTNANPVLVDRLLSIGEFTEDRNLKCFQKCIFEQMKTMNREGQIEAYLERSQVPIRDQVIIHDVLEKCRELRGNDACETAFMVARCLHQAEGSV